VPIAPRQAASIAAKSPLCSAAWLIPPSQGEDGANMSFQNKTFSVKYYNGVTQPFQSF